MKILFLDIDGVINIVNFERDFINNLNKIIKETNAKIVLSSSWRKDGLLKCKERLLKEGVNADIIDTTPLLFYEKCIIEFNDKIPEPHHNSVERGVEIKYWLENTDYDVDTYCIIDDDIDMLYSQKDNFVRCSNRWEENDSIHGYGLTLKATEEVILILNK